MPVPVERFVIPECSLRDLAGARPKRALECADGETWCVFPDVTAVYEESELTHER